MFQLMIPMEVIPCIFRGNPAYKSILITLTDITYQEVLSFNSLVSIGQEDTCRSASMK